jgi:hypothetical protein
VRVWEAAAVPTELWHRRGLVSDVCALFDELLLREEVIAALGKDATLCEADRAFALQVAQTRPQDSVPLLDVAQRLNDAAWDVAKTSSAGKEPYALALRQAEAAVRLAPGDRFILNTLGVAQYRTGRYAEALATLTRSEKLNATEEGADPADLAFLAMVQHQLGKKDEAKVTLARLRNVMKQPRWASDAEAQGFLREAEQLLEDKATKGSIKGSF